MNNQVTKILETNYIAAIESQITKITCQNQATISDLTSKVDKLQRKSVPTAPSLDHPKTSLKI